MKNKTLLPIALLALGLAMAACGPKPADSSSAVLDNTSETTEVKTSETHDSSEVTTSEVESSEDLSSYNIGISNKDALQAEGWVYGASRTIALEVTPAGNITALINSGDIVITSSDTEVVAISGKIATAGKKVGKATITVTYKTHSDSVEVECFGEAAEPEHKKMTVAQCLEEVSDKTQKTVIYDVEAYIVSWNTGKEDATKYGNYYIADSMDSDKKILVYGSSANATLVWGTTSYTVNSPQDFLTNDATKDIAIGYKVKLEVCGLMYGTTQELTGKVVSSEAPAVVAAETVALNYTSAHVRVGATLTPKATLSPVGGVGTLTWASSDSTIATVVDGVITGVKAGTAEISATLEGTTSVAKIEVTVDDAETGVALVDTPVVGTAYKAGIEQANLYTKTGSLYYFLNGAIDGNYLSTTAKRTDAVDVYLEAASAEGGFYLYTKDGDAKKYIELYCSNAEKGYYNPRLVDTPTYAATYDAELKTLVFDVDGTKKVISTSGTGTYSTIGGRNSSSSDFAMHFYSVEAPDDAGGGAVEEPTLKLDHAGTLEDPYSVKDAVAVAKDTGATATKDKYYITGKVSKIASAFSASYGNISVFVSDDGTTTGDQFEFFRLQGLEGAKLLTVYDVEVGDTITAYCDIKTYIKDGQADVYENSSTPCPIISITKASDAKHIALSKTASSLSTGEEDTITAVVGPTLGVDSLSADVKWSGTEGLTLSATTGKSVKISAAAAGSYTLTATYGEGESAVSATCAVTVTAAVSGSTSLDFTKKTSSHAAYNDTWEYGDWKITGAGNNNAGWDYVKVGAKSENLLSDNNFKSKSALENAISSVEIKTTSGSLPKTGMSASVKIEAYSDAEFTTLVASSASATIASATTSYTLTPTTGDAFPANSYYKVAFTIGNTSTTNGVVWVSSVNFIHVA